MLGIVVLLAAVSSHFRQMKMIRLTILFLVSTFLLLELKSNGQTSIIHLQDTLVFQKKKNHNVQFLLPLNEYSVEIKTINGKRKDVIITGYSDTIYTVKIFSYEKGEERNTKKERLGNIYSDSSLTDIQKDSLVKLVYYSILDTIYISEIDKIIVPNSNRKEMNQLLNIVEWSAGIWLGVGMPGIVIFKSGIYFLVWSILGMGIVTVSLIIENKVIKLDKWEIVH